MKIPLYNYLNIMMTGIIFIVLLIFIDIEWSMLILNSLFQYSHNFQSTVVSIFLFLFIYEIGLIINRIGSILVEWGFRKCGIFYFNDNYILFNERKKIYPIIEILSREYAVSRTSISLFAIIGIIYLYFGLCKWAMVSFLIMSLFILSARKYTKKIIDLMK